MNGYRHFLRPVFWFDFYWAAFALLLAFVTHLFWARGPETGFLARLPEAKRRFSPRLRLTSALTLAVFAGVGAFIFYNTNVVNEYQTSHDRQAEQADYEKTYKQVAGRAQPRITEVKVAFDLFPRGAAPARQGKVYAREQDDAGDQDRLRRHEPTDRTFHKLAIGANEKPTRADPQLNFYAFYLKQPLGPGDTATPESIGFLWKTDAQDPQAIDVPYYVTAHEVAHQWWGGQVVGGQVQGSAMLSESMAQYTALMVMKKTFGPQNIKRFLRHELEDYLSGRGLETKKEMPLLRVEGQPYIHDEKGSLVMYALQDYIGEDNLNRALARYVSHVKFQERPYTNSLELLGYIREATPPQLQYVLHDMFETITLYDNRIGRRSAPASIR